MHGRNSLLQWFLVLHTFYLLNELLLELLESLMDFWQCIALVTGFDIDVHIGLSRLTLHKNGRLPYLSLFNILSICHMRAEWNTIFINLLPVLRFFVTSSGRSALAMAQYHLSNFFILRKKFSLIVVANLSGLLPYDSFPSKRPPVNMSTLWGSLY